MLSPLGSLHGIVCLFFYNPLLFAPPRPFLFCFELSQFSLELLVFTCNSVELTVDHFCCHHICLQTCFWESTGHLAGKDMPSSSCINLGTEYSMVSSFQWGSILLPRGTLHISKASPPPMYPVGTGSMDHASRRFRSSPTASNKTKLDMPPGTLTSS